MMRILFVDDDVQAHRTLQMVLPPTYSVLSAMNAARGLERVRSDAPDVVLLDLKLPDGDGLDVLEEIASLPASPPVIILTAYGDVPLVVRAMQSGAANYLVKPYRLNDLLTTLRRVEAARAATLATVATVDHPALQGIVGESPGIKALRHQLLAYATADAPVLLLGESGTGKDLAAQAVHTISNRREGPFVAKNCAAIPESLVETEIFGSEKGAFTDAVTRPGSFEQAHAGTLFLDEIGETSLAVQAKLLRVLEDNQLVRVGGTKSIPIDVRVVSATNRDLKEMMHTGRFRPDLYYRVNILPVRIPPLRERLEDVPLLAEHLVARIDPRRPKLTAGTLVKLRTYDWPGNIRELKSVLERGALLCKHGEIRPQDIIFT